MIDQLKYFKLTTLLLTVAFFACIENVHKPTNDRKEEPIQSRLTNDTFELEKLTKNLYKWCETKSSQIDFDPLLKEKTDTVYWRLNAERHKQRLDELRKTQFFADQFVENYNQIALRIDRSLLDKSLVYYVGELPPYGNGANPWCNCQDYPDNYWKKIKLENIAINDRGASYYWTWGDDFKYKVKAKKENDVWKISFLQGFEINDFLQKAEINR